MAGFFSLSFVDVETLEKMGKNGKSRRQEVKHRSDSTNEEVPFKMAMWVGSKTVSK